MVCVPALLSDSLLEGTPGLGQYPIPATLGLFRIASLRIIFFSETISRANKR